VVSALFERLLTEPVTVLHRMAGAGNPTHYHGAVRSQIVPNRGSSQVNDVVMGRHVIASPEPE